MKFQAVDVVGWAATALFAVSYLSQDSAKIRKVQAAAASLWAAYGLLIHSLPVTVSNLIVISVALSTARRRPREPGDHA